MPTLPTINAQRNVTAQTAEPLRNEVEQKFAPQNAIIKTVTDMTQKWSDANDVMQYTDAKAKYEVSVADINSRAVADPQFKNSPKYIKELQDAKSKSVEEIANVEVRNKTSVELNYSNQVNAIKIESQFKQKQLKYNQAQVQTNLNALVLKRTRVSDSEKQSIDMEIAKIRDLQLSTGTMSQLEMDKAINDAKESAAVEGIFNNTDATIAELKDENGMYASIPTEKRMSLIEKGQNYKTRQKKEFEEVQKDIMFENEAQIATELARGGIVSPYAVIEKVRAGSISSDFAESVMESMTSYDAVNAKTNTEEFSKLTKQIFMKAEREDTQAVIKSILKGGGNGKLSQDDLSILLESAIFMGRTKDPKVKDGMTAVNDWAKNTKDSKEVEVQRDYQKKIIEGKKPEVATRETITENTVKVKPEVIGYPKDGKLMVDKNGNKALVFPDGHYEEVK